jgi:hypothetical protein
MARDLIIAGIPNKRFEQKEDKRTTVWSVSGTDLRFRFWEMCRSEITVKTNAFGSALSFAPLARR